MTCIRAISAIVSLCLGITASAVAVAQDQDALVMPVCEELDAASRATCEVIVKYEELAFEQRRPTEAMELYASEDMVDHHPNIRGDRASAIAHLARLDWATSAPQRKVVHFVIRDDIAIIHHHLIRKPGERGIAAVDIWRVEDGKLVEHWDVLQPIPENSVNKSPMF